MCMVKQELKRIELIFIYITNFIIMTYKKYHLLGLIVWLPRLNSAHTGFPDLTISTAKLLKIQQSY